MPSQSLHCTPTSDTIPCEWFLTCIHSRIRGCNGNNLQILCYTNNSVLAIAIMIEKENDIFIDSIYMHILLIITLDLANILKEVYDTFY